MSRDWTTKPLTDAEHIHADMAAGRFPRRSRREVAMAEIGGDCPIKRAEAWLRECCHWMMGGDLDLICPMKDDPEAIADALAGLRVGYRPAKLSSVTVDENTMIALHGEDTMEIFKTAIHKLAIEIERGSAEPRAEYDRAIERLSAQCGLSTTAVGTDRDAELESALAICSSVDNAWGQPAIVDRNPQGQDGEARLGS